MSNVDKVVALGSLTTLMASMERNNTNEEEMEEEIEEKQREIEELEEENKRLKKKKEEEKELENINFISSYPIPSESEIINHTEGKMRNHNTTNTSNKLYMKIIEANRDDIDIKNSTNYISLYCKEKFLYNIDKDKIYDQIDIEIEDIIKIEKEINNLKKLKTKILKEIEENKNIKFLFDQCNDFPQILRRFNEKIKIGDYIKYKNNIISRDCIGNSISKLEYMIKAKERIIGSLIQFNLMHSNTLKELNGINFDQ